MVSESFLVYIVNSKELVSDHHSHEHKGISVKIDEETHYKAKDAVFGLSQHFKNYLNEFLSDSGTWVVKEPNDFLDHPEVEEETTKYVIKNNASGSIDFIVELGKHNTVQIYHSKEGNHNTKFHDFHYLLRNYLDILDIDSAFYKSAKSGHTTTSEKSHIYFLKSPAFEDKKHIVDHLSMRTDSDLNYIKFDKKYYLKANPESITFFANALTKIQTQNFILDSNYLKNEDIEQGFKNNHISINYIKPDDKKKNLNKTSVRDYLTNRHL